MRTLLALAFTVAAVPAIASDKIAANVEAALTHGARAPILVTLAEQGWIRAREESSTRWETTPRILNIAHSSRSKSDRRQRIQQVLEQLAEQTGETAMFNEPDGSGLTVSQVAESRQALRMVPRIGAAVPVRESATGRVLFPHLSAERQRELLSGPADAEFRKLVDDAGERGYSASSEVNEASMTIAAPVFEADGRALGAIAISGPAERMVPEQHPELATAVRRAAAELSRDLAD